MVSQIGMLSLIPRGDELPKQADDDALWWYVYAVFGGGKTSGVDWVRWIVAVVVAAVLVVIASTVTGRNTSKMSKFKSKFS